MKIRKSTESERKEILNIHNQAFGKEKGIVIAKLVDDLLNDETYCHRGYVLKLS